MRWLLQCPVDCHEGWHGHLLMHAHCVFQWQVNGASISTTWGSTMIDSGTTCAANFAVMEGPLLYVFQLAGARPCLPHSLS